ncbi:hypothetical membrane protein [Rhodococcus opacus B4]|uniref:Hypothetical membrane protein n=2 Tax=Rhodococcus opacus TaxID=37919 RepID=C1AVC6_RHOOB|nr:hypothetical membrane protein [Rhodococcus opacus B4]
MLFRNEFGNRDDDRASADGDRKVTVGVVADSGFASTIASAIEAALPPVIVIGGQRVGLETDRAAVTLPPTATGSAPLGQWLDSVQSTNTYDIVLCISEVPRRRGSTPVVAELHAGSTGALYVPSFGTIAVRRRAVAAAVAVVHYLLDTDTASRPRLRRSLSRWAPGPDPHDRRERVLLTPGIFGRLRLVAGMIRCNRPWRLVPTLSGALAAASAASAFGVFYASIWQMAASMTPLRLVLVGVAAVAAITVWLIFPHGLWEHRSFRSSTTDRWMYNAATLGTVVTGVLCMYAVLFAVVLVSAAVVISPDFLAVQLGRPSSVGDYLSLAWLAASLGTVAGAVGSTVSDRGEILQATYGHREMLRRQAADATERGE